ncbi:DUF1588 domain-containing protein [Planctomycetaceae bacterium SH139]
MLDRPNRTGNRMLASRSTGWLLLSTAILSLLSSDAIAVAPQISDEELRARGEEIYRNRCAECHGEAGEGVDAYYPDRLMGDDSIGQLTETIAETMPEDDPELCEGEDAAAVAAFIHHSFYSEAARLKKRPPRVALARLTANQLRQSLADLYAANDQVANVKQERGIKATYYAGARRKKENVKIERIDPVIDFDFGHESPGEGIEPKSFAINWEGSIRADVTGKYEMVVRSTCSFVMQFGNHSREFINNHVQSGDKTEFRETIVLTAGRIYPFKIDFTQRERSTEQPPASISLSWVPPQQAEQIIPPHNLLPGWAPSVYTLQTDLPPDDRSYGFERGIAIDRQWDESTTAAALEFAEIAISELWPQYERRHRDDSNENRQRLRDFLAGLASRAFRGPLTDAQRQTYVDQQVDATEDDKEAIKRSIILTLKSPRFLYPTIDLNCSESQQAANRLALVLYDSLPVDRWLMEAAEKDRLTSEDQVRATAARMINDYRAQAKTREMLTQWLDLGHFDEIAKDDELFAGFDDQVVSDLRSSLMAFLDAVVWSEASDYRQLFQAKWTFTTDRLAEVYGDSWQPAEEGQGPRRSQPDAEHRFGVLTHPLLMSGLSYHDATSPIHRGVFLIRHLLGRTLRPPADVFPPLSPDLHPDLNTRERVALQTSPESCQVCHSKINGLGFVLENYDPIGRYRATDADKPVDATGAYTDRQGNLVDFVGPAELADYLATSDDALEAFVNRAFQHFVKQPIAAFGPNTQAALVEKFRASGFNIRELIVEVAVIAARQPHSPDLQES